MSTHEAVLYTNGEILLPSDGFVRGGFIVREGRFVSVFAGDMPAEAEACANRIDLGGCRILPGLVDIHVHGTGGADCSDASAEGLAHMGSRLAANGTTTFLPTTMTLPIPALKDAFVPVGNLMKQRPEGCARIAGIRMEGPYLSPEKKGSHNPSCLIPPDAAQFQDLYASSGGIIRIVDVAPELPNAAELIRTAKDLCMVSIAHTTAGYDTAKAAFDAGARHLTHLFNAMPPLTHRSPGVIGAAAEQPSVSTELICDGLHVHPSAVRAAFTLFQKRICLISDALRCADMPAGSYELAGQTVILSETGARLPDGTLAGSSVSLYTCLKRAIAFGIPEKEAIDAATLRPATLIGYENLIGSLSPGKAADFLLCDREWNLLAVYLDGKKLEISDTK